MRLLFAIKSLNVVGGGAERVLVDVANGMARRGHDVQVLTFDSMGESFYPLDPLVRRIDTAIGLPGHPTPRLRLLASMPRIRKLALEARADLVVGFMHSTYVPLATALLGSGVPIVFSEHIDEIHYRTRPMQRLSVRLAGRLALAKTVPSVPLREAHAQRERRHVHVLPNAVDVAAFSQAGSKPPQGPPVILSVGRFMAQKNQKELIRAFARVAAEYPHWILKLVGDGDDRSELEGEVVRLGLTRRVLLPGASRDIASEYAGASIVALPSRYESFGLVAAEALASGRALLAFDDCVGIAEMVTDGHNGLLVSAQGDRVENLASGLRILMGDVALRERLAAAGPASVVRFSPERVLETWERFFLGPGSEAQDANPNRDERTIASFGDEWSVHTQSDMSAEELEEIFDTYFHIFPWSALPAGAIGFDMGCGSGRWANLIAPRVGHLHCIEPAHAALTVARANLASVPNVSFHEATTQTVGLPDQSCDFGYSLGVLHHIPDTQRALADCARILKPGAPFLIYLYYRFDNRPAWFRGIWHLTNLVRLGVSRLPAGMKRPVTNLIALFVYWPVSRMSRVLEAFGFDVSSVPLSFYRKSSMATLLTDSRDRLGTPFERRFTRAQIGTMMAAAGFADVRFSEEEPYWCCVGYRK